MKKFLKMTVAIALIAIASCSKYDDSALWKEVNEQDARLAALEAWQQTVNSNITALQGLVTALQNNKTITAVNPFSTPVPGGYTITFNTGSPITIYHGTNGADGTDGADGEDGADGTTPQIGVAESPAGSGNYYWTLNGAFILVNGQMIPTTGQDGQDGQDGEDGEDGQNGQDGTNAITPQLRINTETNYWEISYDNGATWTSLNVRATGNPGAAGATGSQGPVGPQGPQGDAIFAPNGVDDSNPDYVVFTLADGVTTITIPRYKEMGITLSGELPKIYGGNTQSLTFATNGEVETVRVIDVPDAWTVQTIYNKLTGDGTFKVTAPRDSRLTTENSYAEPLVLLSGADGKAVVLTGLLKLRTQTPDYAANDRVWVIRNDTARNIFGSPGGIRQVWSAPIEMPDCNKAGYDGGANAAPLADGRRFDGYEGYYYSWEYVNQRKNDLCPSGWRLPDDTDFLNLDIALGGAGATGAIPFATYFKYTDDWNITRNGMGINGSPYLQLTSESWYWTQYESYSAGVYWGVGFNLNHGSMNVSYLGQDKSWAMQVRCVRDMFN
jgi:uncharacterized protein (TIGR02145 family)